MGWTAGWRTRRTGALSDGIGEEENGHIASTTKRRTRAGRQRSRRGG